MKYTESGNNGILLNEVHISFSFFDMVTANFDADDREYLSDCNESDSIADKLLGLERIARRLEQQQSKRKKINVSI